MADTENSRIVQTDNIGDCRVIVVDHTDDREVMVHHTGQLGELASFSYDVVEDVGIVEQSVNRKEAVSRAEEYANGYVHCWDEENE